MDSINAAGQAGKTVAVIGGGPAGLIAAETLARAGCAVTVYDQKPSVGRKFMMAGRGGLNLTHSEAMDAFLPRYGAARKRLEDAIAAFPPAALRAWCEGLAQPTFVGTSGRVFPQSFKASPLLRAWLARLDSLGVRILTNRRWIGWDRQDHLAFLTADQEAETASPQATLLALGGASWPKLGSDGSWTAILTNRKVPITPLRPANCGFRAAWSDVFRERFAGTPVKPVVLSQDGIAVQGELIVTQDGIEGGTVYALSARLRDTIDRNGSAYLTLDLRPGISQDELHNRLAMPRGRQSLSSHLRKKAGLPPVAIGLLRETQTDQAVLQTLSPAALASLIKAAPLRLTASAPINRAISSAGGIALDALDPDYMIKKIPGVFAAGEMLDWEAPTGGYLLQACFSTGVAAAEGILKRLES